VGGGGRKIRKRRNIEIIEGQRHEIVEREGERYESKESHKGET